MAYSLAADIQSEYKAINFAASGAAVSTAEVTEFITQADAFIDGIVSNRYETPVTGTVSLAILKTISIWLVKSRINSILSVKTPQDKNKQDPDGPTLRTQALEMLKQIKNGQLKLPDAVGSDTEGGMTSFLMNEELDYVFPQESESW